MIVPDMPTPLEAPCRPQWYGKLPASGNVCRNDCEAARFPESKPGASEVTVWV